ncbi:hypothetical protein [Rhizobium leguminosarum]|uniref:hypothetical protein n=1 Tax=Rhizobium leguminosarum TaxID=384 RepID=UPI00098F7EDC|nr:hypothetical protein [Rhizobium leguminosarum]MBB5259253.1 hypothetical protein [Rhizobium leguminosarum]MDX6002548.1 hypothetical protein [Rhizobium leguminosarum]OOO51515.1 hypothetical protein BS629_11835 [Rhizobium leguminosarum bv. viciae USDA 2370]PUB61966.1 hypothetical protein DB728_24710 [Rhizobium leguminosarum bv. viciae USDA 2370]TCA80198.1 hypothetical protein E0H74_27915 [Rhizobium leguminosarum bv. viciae]
MSDAPILFRKRRTYLDECRERGVFQKHEELLAENAELTSQIANVKKSAVAELHDIASHSPSSAAFSDALEACRNEMRARAALIFDAFASVGLGAAYLPLLAHVLIHTDTPGEEAEGLFRAAAAPSTVSKDK